MGVGFFIFNNFQVILMEIVQTPHFEKHWAKGTKSLMNTEKNMESDLQDTAESFAIHSPCFQMGRLSSFKSLYPFKHVYLISNSPQTNLREKHKFPMDYISICYLDLLSRFHFLGNN